MEVPVFIESQPGGFKATTGAPLNISTEAATAAVGQQVQSRLQSGELRLLKLTDVESIAAAAREMREDPFYDEWFQGLDEYRRIHNAIPDYD